MTRVRANIKKKRLRETFLELVRIAGPSRKERGVADYVIARVGGKFEITEDRAAGAVGGDAGNIIVRVPGEGRAILLTAHMDTVGPCDGVRPRVRNGYVYSAGDTVLGADDRSAVAALLEFLEVADGLDRRCSVELVFTVCEEVGLLGAKALDYSAFSAGTGYVFDTSHPPGTAVTAAPSSDILTAVVRGRAAHAGLEPEKGVSAVQIASAAIADMKLGRIDHETTANIGKIEGGTAINIVPAEAVVRGEVRSHDKRKLDAHVSHITACLQKAARHFGGSADVKWEAAYRSYKIPESAPVVVRYKEACERLDLETRFLAAGGGSDANIFNTHGIRSIVVGCGMENPHTSEERIRLSDLETLTAVALQLATVPKDRQ